MLASQPSRTAISPRTMSIALLRKRRHSSNRIPLPYSSPATSRQFLQHRQQARDLLRAGRHLAPRRQFGEKRLALYLSHLSWMPLATCQNEASDPAYIRLLSPQTVMAKPQPTTDLIQQLRSRRRHYACIVTGVRMCLLKRWITQAASTPTPSVAIHKSLLWDRNSPFPDLWP